MVEAERQARQQSKEKSQGAAGAGFPFGKMTGYATAG
jgi:hypothetical protein